MLEQEYQLNTSIEADTPIPATFFEGVYQAFQKAEKAMGLIDHFYAIGGHTVRLCFAGSALVSRITPALEHLITEPTSSPALTVCLWDSASTGIPLPPPPWSADASIARGEVRGCIDDHIHISFQLWDSILNMFDNHSALATFWLPDARQLPYHESGAPLRSILHWWLGIHGLQFVHAAAVGTVEGGVLLAGKSGSGKSTTALNCLKSQLVYVSDDYCLVAADPQPYVYSLYNSAKVNADNIHRVPHLKSAISNADRLDSEKALLFLYEHFPEKIVNGFPLRAVLLPRVTGHPETRLTPVSPATGLRALAPSTIFQLAGAGKGAFQTMAKLVKKIPCYHLELGTDISGIPGVISDLVLKG